MTHNVEMCKCFSSLERIGTGSSSDVYSAIFTPLGTPVALKVFYKDEKYNKELYLKEIEILKCVNHPFIAQYYSCYETPHMSSIIMELGENGTLLNYMNKMKRITIIEIKKFFSQIASAIRYLHINKKIIHRDIKLENFILDKNMSIRLLDFGFSTRMAEKLDQSGTNCGSIDYSAPELFISPNLSYSSDIWSLGVTFYALAAGKMPFFAENSEKVVNEIINNEPIFPKFIPPDLIDLLLRMMDKDPATRITITDVCEHPFFKGSPLQYYISDSFRYEERTETVPKKEELFQMATDLGIVVKPMKCDIDMMRAAHNIMIKMKNMIKILKNEECLCNNEICILPKIKRRPVEKHLSSLSIVAHGLTATSPPFKKLPYSLLVKPMSTSRKKNMEV